jgi:hypothetical protein
MKRTINYLLPPRWLSLLTELAVATAVCLVPVTYSGGPSVGSLKIGLILATFVLSGGEIVRQSIGWPRIAQYIRDLRNAFQGLVELRALNTYSKLIQIDSSIDRLGNEVAELRNQTSSFRAEILKATTAVSSLIDTLTPRIKSLELYQRDIHDLERNLVLVPALVDKLESQYLHLDEQFSASRATFDRNVAVTFDYFSKHQEETRDLIIQLRHLHSTGNSQVLRAISSIEQSLASLGSKVEKALQKRERSHSRARLLGSGQSEHSQVEGWPAREPVRFGDWRYLDNPDVAIFVEDSIYDQRSLYRVWHQSHELSRWLLPDPGELLVHFAGHRISTSSLSIVNVNALTGELRSRILKLIIWGLSEGQVEQLVAQVLEKLRSGTR